MHDSINSHPRVPGLILPALLLMFAAGLYPLAADFVLFHPDERHYLHAAVTMLETGDHLTPRTAEGDLRLKKPILPYWCTAAGFRIAGITPLGARLGFLIAGAAIVALAWWGALIAFDSRTAACFAAAAAMTQPALLISAPRSVPDVLLACGVTLSACGFLRIERDGRTTGIALLAAFGGAAMAVMSKGSPGAVFLGFALLFTAWRRPALFACDPKRWLGAVAVCLVIGGSWFAAMAGMHTQELFQQFAHDQFGPNRFVRNPWQAMTQFPLCVGLLAVMSAPWLIASAAVLRSPALRARFWRQPGVALLLAWAVMYCALAAMINHVTPRYLLPVAAPLSIVIGGLLHLADANGLRKRLWWVLPIGGVMIACSALVLGMQLVDRIDWLLACVSLLLLVNLATTHRIRRWTAMGQCLAITASLLLTVYGIGAGLAMLRDGGIGNLVCTQLQRWNGKRTCSRIALLGEAAHAAQIQVAVGNRFAVEQLAVGEDLHPRDLLVLDSDYAAQLDLSHCHAQQFACGYRNMRADAFLQSLVAGRLAEFLKRSERQYVIATPINTPDPEEIRTAASLPGEGIR